MLIVLVSSVDDIVATMTCPEQETVLAPSEANNTKEAAAETGDCQPLLLLEDSSLFHVLSSLLVLTAIHSKVVASTWYM